MNNIKIFENEKFGKIRTTGTADNPMFCLSDICKILALDSSQVMKRLEDGVVSIHPIQDSLGRTQQANFVNEDGLYDVILDSRKPEARAFRKWVTSEVLPSIRKTGGYIISTPEMTNEEILARALIVANETIKKRDEQLALVNGDCDRLEKKVKSLRNVNAMLEDENAFRKQRNIRDSEEKANLSAMVTARNIKIDGLKQQITEAQPKLDYLSNILANQSDVVITEIAKDYGMSGKAFNKLLYKLGIQYKVNKTWVLYAKHDNKGYTNGNKIEVKQNYFVEQTVWTPRGRIFIYEELKKNGILPLMER